MSGYTKEIKTNINTNYCINEPLCIKCMSAIVHDIFSVRYSNPLLDFSVRVGGRYKDIRKCNLVLWGEYPHCWKVSL